MITGLQLVNFKCFSASSFDFRPLTVVTGGTGAGKSTLLQGLLLVRQAAEDGRRLVVQLNGPYRLSLGVARDVLNFAVDVPAEIELVATESGVSYQYVFGGLDDQALNLPISRRPSSSPESLAAPGKAFTYLNAERLGPRDSLDVTAEERGRVGVGAQGEYTAQALAMYESEEVRPKLRHPDQEPGDGMESLSWQVGRWASSIIRPIVIRAQQPPGMAASLIRFQEPNPVGQSILSDPIRPGNMGFGFSYALPILVAGLLMPVGGVLIVENPEAHLPPSGQSKLGRFLARVAGSGAQVIVETHSDHVVNGMRLAAAEDHVIDTQDVLFHFFGDEPGQAPTSIELNERGALSEWPKGFFDQIDEDLRRIALVKRSGR